MHLSRVLALTAAAALLASCNAGGTHRTAGNVPHVTLTTAAATATPSVTKAPATATPTPTATVTATAARTTSPTPTVRRTTARPVATATTARPTPAPTTAKPKPTATPPPATGTVPLSISGHAFNPQIFSIPRGTTVKATNHEAGVPHDWTSNSGVWSSGTLAFGQSYSYRFMTKGAFNFSCTIHPDMTGRVTVT